MPDVLEITTFALAPGLMADDFVRANADIDEFLRRQPGFLWRRIAERDDGTIVDVVAYDSTSHARAAAAGISGEMGNSPVHGTIDHDTVEWHLATVVREVP